MLRDRSQQKEIIDLGSAYYTEDEFTHCQDQLFRINKLFGYFNQTKRLLKTFSPRSSVADFGCGGGRFVIALSQYFPQMSFTGIDLSADAIAIAKRHCEDAGTNNNIQFQLLDLANKNSQQQFDIVLATLVCHHFNDDELIVFLQNAYQQSRHAVIINDLQRSSLAYLCYKIISPLFRNRLITHDGLISIKRGFTRQEWQTILIKAGITKFKIQWRMPFWWKVILWKK